MNSLGLKNEFVLCFLSLFSLTTSLFSLTTVHINDLRQDIVSQVRLYADDTAIYLTLDSRHESDCLQRDLDRLQARELKWDMEFNPSKCQVVHVTSARAAFNTRYILHGQVLEAVTRARYLRVDISNNLSCEQSCLKRQ